jgi:DNA (cytosine-5)-methyltransferase 1
MHYYNENDTQLVEWLENLIKAGLLPEGDVDGRSIADVRGSDLKGYTQCHFFAGIGGWPLALELAGWPTTRPVWTGSCPCQPFSNAGTQGGTDDPRHLWPQFQRLINECNPPVVFGEQVASKAGRAWLSGVRTDLEELGYGVGGADLCGASIGSPHIRQRLYWVADAERSRLMDAEPHNGEHHAEGRPQRNTPLNERKPSKGRSDEGGMADTAGGGFGEAREPSELRTGGPVEPSGSEGIPQQATDEEVSQWGRPVNPTPWDGAVWLQCLDNRERRIEPRIRPLADGVPGRVVKLRAYGNAIIPQVGAEFVTSFMEIEEGRLQ